jgi:hypothetical protein
MPKADHIPRRIPFVAPAVAHVMEFGPTPKHATNQIVTNASQFSITMRPPVRNFRDIRRYSTPQFSELTAHNASLIIEV